ncbi:MAG: hypothetical protein H6741_01185 [Alphaproteobacteria bacterium]|nr:hypothetical protein [Alphaproteobacteria bacterium]
MLLLALALACRPPEPGAAVAEPGELGPYGVEQSVFYAARGTGRWFAVDLHLPTEDGALAQDRPALVLTQGGAVERERYHWLAEDLAAQGYAVLTPQYPSDLAFFGAERAYVALRRARKLDEAGDPVLSGVLGERVGALGHSLGGVVSAKEWLEHDFDALVLMASYAADGDEVEERDAPVLSILGSEDGSVSLEDAQAGAERFPDARLACVQGMTHYDWTDEVTDKEREKEGTSALRPAAESRADALAVIEDYLAGALLDDSEARQRLDAGAYAGVSFEGCFD